MTINPHADLLCVTVASDRLRTPNRKGRVRLDALSADLLVDALAALADALDDEFANGSPTPADLYLDTDALVQSLLDFARAFACPGSSDPRPARYAATEQGQREAQAAQEAERQRLIAETLQPSDFDQTPDQQARALARRSRKIRVETTGKRPQVTLTTPRAYDQVAGVRVSQDGVEVYDSDGVLVAESGTDGGSRFQVHVTISPPPDDGLVQWNPPGLVPSADTVVENVRRHREHAQAAQEIQEQAAAAQPHTAFLAEDLVPTPGSSVLVQAIGDPDGPWTEVGKVAKPRAGTPAVLDDLPASLADRPRFKERSEAQQHADDQPPF